MIVHSKRPDIERAALRLFVTRGVRGTTVRDIAADAGVAEGTLYRHWRSKRDLARTLFRASAAALADDVRRAAEAETTASAKLVAALRARCPAGWRSTSRSWWALSSRASSRSAAGGPRRERTGARPRRAPRTRAACRLGARHARQPARGPPGPLRHLLRERPRRLDGGRAGPHLPHRGRGRDLGAAGRRDEAALPHDRLLRCAERVDRRQGGHRLRHDRRRRHLARGQDGLVAPPLRPP